MQHGVDLVVNLAAGLDTRPYRMALPPSLRWVEVDLPDILDYKEEILAGAAPACALERVQHLARLVLGGGGADESHGEAAGLEELFQPRPQARELILAQGLEHVEERQ